jgi:hypothetical protein
MSICPKSVAVQGALTIAAAVSLCLVNARSAQAQSAFNFTASDLVGSVEGN